MKSLDNYKKLNVFYKYRRLLSRFQDKDFLDRVYAKDLNYYIKRLKKIRFINLEKVLDAGCGFGQWGIALSYINKTVTAIDINSERILVAQKIAQELKRENLHFLKSSLEKLPYKDESLDGIFCYSVIYQTNYIESLKEFFRVLKKGGILYFSTNTWGWYIYNLIKNHNPSLDFSPRRYVISTLLNTLKFSLFRIKERNKDLTMSPKLTLKILKNIGFKDIKIGPEGTLSLNEEFNDTVEPIYSSKYLGMSRVYEVISTK